MRGVDRGTIRCRGFLNVNTTSPSLVAFIGMDVDGDVVAARLGEEFCRRMQAFPGAEEARAGRTRHFFCCDRVSPSFRCRPTSLQDGRKLLVLVGEGPPPSRGRTLEDLPDYARAWIANMELPPPQWNVLTYPSEQPFNYP